jgi:hypothetical protein
MPSNEATTTANCTVLTRTVVAETWALSIPITYVRSLEIAWCQKRAVGIERDWGVPSNEERPQCCQRREREWRAEH